MDDKELVKKVKNSLRANKSQAEILTGFQKRGYKLEYADKIITRAKRPKRIIITLLITIVIFFSLTFSAYTIFSNKQKMDLLNPLSDLKTGGLTSSQSTLSASEIEITPEIISFLLNEIGAWELHKNPLTLQSPVINFKIEDKKFHSKIGSEIKTLEGLSSAADLQFNMNKLDIINAVTSKNPIEVLKKSISEGRTQIKLKATETELFAKGYLKLYESLN